MLTAQDLILCDGKHKRYCCQMPSFCLEFLVVIVGDITTILGFFFLSFDQKPCNGCGEKLSAFLVLRSAGAATRSPCRSRIALKQELSENSSQTSIGLSQESHSTGAPVCSLELGSSSRSTVSKGLVNVLTFYLKIGSTSIDNHHRAFDSNNLHLQTFSRFSSLLNFARIPRPVKYTCSYLKIGRNKLHSSGKISANVFSLLDFEMCLHSQLLNLLIQEVLFR